MRKRNKKTLMVKKIIVVLAAVVLLVSATIGGTLAWLTSTTGTVTNTFTVGDINIELKESTLTNGQLDSTLNSDNTWTNLTESVDNYKFIPGTDLNKNPTVKVEAKSEKCFLFVTVELKNWPANENIMLDLNTEGGWTLYSPATNNEIWTTGEGLKNGTIVLYREVAYSESNQYFNILENNKIEIDNGLTKADVDRIETALNKNSIQLIFKAAAIQYENVNDVDTAWSNLPDAFKKDSSNNSITITKAAN